MRKVYEVQEWWRAFKVRSGQVIWCRVSQYSSASSALGLVWLVGSRLQERHFPSNHWQLLPLDPSFPTLFFYCLTLRGLGYRPQGPSDDPAPLKAPTRGQPGRKMVPERGAAKPNRNSCQGDCPAPADPPSRVHRRNDSDSRVGGATPSRRPHTDGALVRRSELVCSSRLELALQGGRNAEAGKGAEPVLTDYNPRPGEEARPPPLRRQVSLDSELNASGADRGPVPRERREWGPRREKTDLELRRAELRSELERRRVSRDDLALRHEVDHPKREVFTQQVSPERDAANCTAPVSTSP